MINSASINQWIINNIIKSDYRVIEKDNKLVFINCQKIDNMIKSDYICFECSGERIIEKDGRFICIDCERTNKMRTRKELIDIYYKKFPNSYDARMVDFLIEAGIVQVKEEKTEAEIAIDIAIDALAKNSFNHNCRQIVKIIKNAGLKIVKDE